MISFDVKSLFTNVPLEEAIDIILNLRFMMKRKLKQTFLEI